jgi:peroxiredoxin
VWVLALACTGLVVLLAVNFSGTTGKGGSTEVGAAAPDFSLEDVSGRTVKLSDLRGKPVFVNFWASWCWPCREELPDIQRLFEAKQGAVNIITVNLTSTEVSADEVRRFVKDSGFTMPVLLDTGGEVGEEYQIRSLPLSLYLDDKGIIRKKINGVMTAEMLENFVDVSS